MTKEEATTIFKIMSIADMGCSYCVADLCKEFLKSFPEHTDTINNLHDKWWKETTYDGSQGKERPKEE